MTNFIHPMPGFELDWLGIDIHGHVGLFSSGGEGPIPRAVFEHLAEVETAIEHLNVLPVLGTCAQSPRGSGDYSSWIEPARRGLFGFDWEPGTGGPYVRLTIPSCAITIEDLADPDVQKSSLLVRLPIDFYNVSSIDRDALGVDLYKEPF
jgi:hypothetical protein